MSWPAGVRAEHALWQLGIQHDLAWMGRGCEHAIHAVWQSGCLMGAAAALVLAGDVLAAGSGVSALAAMGCNRRNMATARRVLAVLLVQMTHKHVPSRSIAELSSALSLQRAKGKTVVWHTQLLFLLHSSCMLCAVCAVCCAVLYCR